MQDLGQKLWAKYQNNVSRETFRKGGINGNEEEGQEGCQEEKEIRVPGEAKASPIFLRQVEPPQVFGGGSFALRLPPARYRLNLLWRALQALIAGAVGGLRR